MIIHTQVIIFSQIDSNLSFNQGDRMSSLAQDENILCRIRYCDRPTTNSLINYIIEVIS
ncbi:MAG: hypothetical protein AAF298_13015 [Cyanobacteria bacterium P01_A01_bin.40]